MNSKKLKTRGRQNWKEKGREVFFAFCLFALAFLYWCLFPACWACIVSNSQAPGTAREIQSSAKRIGPPHHLLLADRTETKDRVIYGTDPDMERAMEEQAREEKEKEDKAWKMLQHMDLYKDIGKRPGPVPPKNTPSQ